jgi:hypothetical protein
MSTRPLLTSDNNSFVEENTRLKRELAGLEQELAQAKDEAQKAKHASADAIHAIRTLRKTLEPMYTAMKMVFGEILRVDAEAARATPAGGDNGDVWPDRVAKLGGKAQAILQVLIDGAGPMTLSQVARAAHCDPRTGSARLSELMARNWVQKVGHGQYAIKQ